MRALVSAELRKVLGSRIFPMLLAVLAAANLLLLWMGTRPTVNQPSAQCYRQLAEELAGLSMEERGRLLTEELEQVNGLLKLSRYYQEVAWGYMGNYAQTYREENADLFEAYDQMYREGSYPTRTGSLTTDYVLLNQLKNEYDTVAGYTDFLDEVQNKAGQLAGISIFHQEKTGYDMKNIQLTAQAYGELDEVEIDYYPQKGLYTALSYPFTDLLLLTGMLLIALLLVRQERDSGLLSVVRSTPAGRLKTALAKLTAFALALILVLALLYGVNLVYCAATFGLGPLSRTIQSVPALMRCTMQITVGEYLGRFLLAKWAGAFVMGLWVMTAALTARHAVTGWAGALALPLAMYGIRAAIPATSRWNVVKYANLASLLQSNELLGNYRNLYWFANPVGLPLVEWTAAVIYGLGFILAFCLVFERAQLLPAPAISWNLGRRQKTRPTTIAREECRKLLALGGAALVVIGFLGFGIYEGATSESYLSAKEIYYAYYMKELSGPLTRYSVQWFLDQAEEFDELLEVQQQVQSGQISAQALSLYTGIQEKYGVYQTILNSKIHGSLERDPHPWAVYESGWLKLFDLDDETDLQDCLYAGLACALCFGGLFAMEQKGGMMEILCATPLGRKRTVRAKLTAAAGTATVIGVGSLLPHLWQVVRDYGLPAVLAPACYIQEFSSLPRAVTLSDLLLLWVICRVAGCLWMGAVILALGHFLKNAFWAIFTGAAIFCLPPLLALSGMENGIHWLGAYPLFHAIALWGNRGYNTGGQPANQGWASLLFLAMALLVIWLLCSWLTAQYQEKGLKPDDI